MTGRGTGGERRGGRGLLDSDAERSPDFTTAISFIDFDLFSSSPSFRIFPLPTYFNSKQRPNREFVIPIS